MKALTKYYKNVKEELSKVIFPTKEQIRNAFISVVVVVAVVTIFLAIVDFILHYALSKVL
ncbi:preprotein translocase subunit SecE [Helicobacter sp. 11S02629-2]|uniref:preprotein translocase subunit SecE n=1 Tax=Helicobacter sp. 11S02629-2 TaxID=1476195 RepID=UPI000BA4E75F|nr:preprotein translocase subunit SecE [Helicobacter sp. 11S02629-2]PAF45717.1 preprotein translocase subunit SecE [Helicobacter sp. 11S02629-2]